LGAPSWLPGTDPELARDYGSEQELQLDDDRLRLFAERIRLISDPILDERINTARTWMREAEVVCFLGFGYHHINLRRLDVRSLEGIVVRGTAMDIAPGEMTAIMREFSHRPNLELFADGRADILQFLRATTIVHD